MPQGRTPAANQITARVATADSSAGSTTVKLLAELSMTLLNGSKSAESSPAEIILKIPARTGA